MRLALAAATVALALVGSADAASGETSLQASVWPKGEGTARVVRTLRCDPAGGSVRRPAAACRAIAAAGRAAFRAVPADSVCTEIYGGPAVALVTGRLEGRPVWARFNRENGCQINRWQRLVLLLGPAGLVR